jgi:hypothetical protein
VSSEGVVPSPRPTFPWVAVIGLLVVLGVGTYVLVDMKPWSAKKFQDPPPKSTLKILGRDDPATLAELRAEMERKGRIKPLASASASVAPPSSAQAVPAQSNAAEPSARPR